MGTGWLLINWGWALGVFAGVLVSYKSGGHLNPAVTLGFLAAGNETYATGVPVTAASTAVYLIAELIGAMIGAGLMYLAYKQHLDAEPDPGKKLGVFATGASLGGPTGYAINPTRDLGPRIMHAILPIKGKGSSDWATPGCRSSARSSAACSPVCCPTSSSRDPSDKDS